MGEMKRPDMTNCSCWPGAQNKHCPTHGEGGGEEELPIINSREVQEEASFHAGENLYPCAAEGCDVMRTKAEGGTTFTVCDKHWKEKYPPKPTPPAEEVERLRRKLKNGDGLNANDRVDLTNALTLLESQRQELETATKALESIVKVDKTHYEHH